MLVWFDLVDQNWHDNTGGEEPVSRGSAMPPS